MVEYGIHHDIEIKKYQLMMVMNELRELLIRENFNISIKYSFLARFEFAFFPASNHATLLRFHVQCYLLYEMFKIL